MTTLKGYIKKIELPHLFAVISLFVVVALIVFRDISFLQVLIAAIAVFLYIIIAFLHHLVDKSLTFEVIIEYILIAVLVLMILQGFLY